MHTLFEMIKQKKYNVVISTLVIDELSATKDISKRGVLLDYVDVLGIEPVRISDEMKIIANSIIKMGILTENHLNDCHHIACALVTGCHYLVTYNIKNMCKVKTIDGVRAISALLGYGNLDIVKAITLI